MSVSIKLIDGEDPKSLYQYDIGRQIQIITNGGEAIKEVQFSNVRLPEALIVLPKLDESGNIIADVPNIFTLEPRIISVYLIMYLENGECVKYKDELNVVPRKKPSDYVYTETEVLNYSLLEKQINSLESTKLTAPSTAKVGQIFRVQSITEDGNLVLEAVDMPSGGSGGAVDDVQIDGKSIVGENGVAEIPMATTSYSGVIRSASQYSLTNWRFENNHKDMYYVQIGEVDYAVKAAMCDGKGAAWTADEQAAARARMGIGGDWEYIDEITLSEDAGLDITLNKDYKKIYMFAKKPSGTSYVSETRLFAHDKNNSSWEQQKGAFLQSSFENDYTQILAECCGKLSFMTKINSNWTYPYGQSPKCAVNTGSTDYVINHICTYACTLPAGLNIKIWGVPA